MPLRAHSSSKLSNTSHKRSSHQTQIQNPNSTNLSLKNQGQLQSNLGGTNNRSSTNLTASTSNLSAYQRRKPFIKHNALSQKLGPKKSNLRRGAFKGALDDDDDHSSDGEAEDMITDQAEDDQVEESFQFKKQPLNTLPRVEDEWVSEPSTRSGTPTSSAILKQDNNTTLTQLATTEATADTQVSYAAEDGRQMPPQSSSSNTTGTQCVVAANEEDDDQAGDTQVGLGLQLPNPLSSHDFPRISPPTESQPIDFIKPQPPPSPTPREITIQSHHSRDQEPREAPRGRSRSRNRLGDSADRDKSPERSRVGARSETPQPTATSLAPSTHSRHRSDASTSNINSQADPVSPSVPSPSSTNRASSSRTSNKGKSRAIDDEKLRSSGPRSSINSIRSLTSLSAFHHECLAKVGSGGLRRVESSASVVLPPKVDKTEAVINLTGKISAFNPTLGVIADDNPDFLGEDPKTMDVVEESKSKTGRAGLDTSQSPVATSSKVTLPQSDCIKRLQRYSEPRTKGGNSKYIDLKNAAHGSSNATGLMSSLLSPRIAFRPKKPVMTPSATTAHHGSGGYFDSIRSFVGFSGILEEGSPGSDVGSRKDERSSKLVGGESSSSTKGTSTFGSSGAISTEASSNHPLSSSKEGHAARTLTMMNLRMRQGKDEPAEVKPKFPGFITTCGPIPVISKFPGPRPAGTAGIFQGELSGSPSGKASGGKRITITRSVSESRQKTNQAPVDQNKRVHSESPRSEIVVGSEPSSSTGSNVYKSQGKVSNDQIIIRTQSNGQRISRIQRKLLMERDRPVSPTPLMSSGKFNRDDDENGVLGETGGEGGLPPPSYLIKSLGRQTGPLPIFPIDLINRKSQEIAYDPTLKPMLQSGNLRSLKEKSGGGLEGELSMMSTNSKKKPTANCNSNIEQLNQPAQRAKQAQMIKLWRNSLIDEVESVLNDHESNCRFRDPLIESLDRVCLSKSRRTLPSSSLRTRRSLNKNGVEIDPGIRRI